MEELKQQYEDLHKDVKERERQMARESIDAVRRKEADAPAPMSAEDKIRASLAVEDC